MDFNLILLFAGLGLLALVALCALLGFIAGLKRELTCIAVFIVLLVLTWLVFGDAATILNAKFGQSVANMLGINDSSIVTLWDAIVAYAKTIIPNGESLLVEGKETYNLFLSVVSTVCRAAGLLVGTIAILIICPIIRFITFIVRLIVKKANKQKAKGVEVNENKVDEQVVVDNEGDDEEAIITTEENHFKKRNSKHRLLGAAAGAVKGLFVAVLVCVPLSGITSILDTASAETEKLLSDVVNGEVKVEVSNSTNPVEMAFDFAEAYDNSAIGKFDGISAFFFKESFSQRLFDQMLKMELADEKVYLTDEIKVFIEAANTLEGNVNFKSMSKEEFAAVLNALKESKLVAKLMPVIIEYAAEMESVNDILGDEKVAFLDLRYIDWKGDIDLVLDAVIEAYDLGLFPISDINVLTLDAEELRDVVELLGQTELMNEAYPLIVKVALNLEALQNLIGDISDDVYVDDLNIANELNALVDIYAKIQELGITSLADLDVNALVEEILTNEEKLDFVLGLVKDVLDLEIAQAIVVPAVFGFIGNNENLTKVFEDAGNLEDFMLLKYFFTLDDVKAYLDVAKVALDLVDLSQYPEIKFDVFALNPDKLTEVIDELFNVSVTTDLFAILSEVAINLDALENLLGDSIEEVTLEGVDWEAELKLFVEIYAEFLKLGFESAEDLQGDVLALVKDIINDEQKFEALANALNKLIDAQIYSKVVAPVAQYFLNKTLADANLNEFEGIVDLEEITNEQWHEDIDTILDIVENVNDLGVLDNLNPFDFNELDITSEEGNAIVKELISNIFDLNILGDDATKTEALLATIEKYEWTTLPDNFDKASINWENEEAVILALVDLVKEIDALEKFDIHDLANTNWVELLENDEFIDYVVSVLETLVESNIFVETLPGVINKYLLPKLELGGDFDDADLIKDIMDKFGDDAQGSKDLVDEIIKLVDILRAAVELNLLDAKDGGLGAIDLANTDALKRVVNGIFESKFLEDNEGRIIRIILKLAKVLDIPLHSDLYNELVSIDYDGEQEVLVSFIDALAPVLQDEEFSVVNEEGKLNVDLTFWTKDATAQALLNALDVVFGAYEDENAKGSKLAATLLPSLYDKFIEEANLIPENFAEVIEILGVSDASGEALMQDISCLTYIVDKLVELHILDAINGSDFNISSVEATEIICEIIDVLYDINLFKGNETAFVEWGVNFALEKLNFELDLNEELDTITSEDWLAQKDEFKAIISQVTALLRNDIEGSNAEYCVNTFADLKDFINNKEYATEKFIQPEVVNAVTDILDDLIEIKLFKVIIPEAAKYVLENVLKDKGLDLTYILELEVDGKEFNEFIIEDLHKLFEIVDYAAIELNACEYVNNGFKGALELPEVEKVQSLIDKLYELSLFRNIEFVELVAEKVFEKLDQQGDLIITVEDLGLDAINWKEELAVLKDFIALAYDLLDAMNAYTLDDVLAIVKDQQYLDINMIREETFAVLSDALRVVSDSQLLANVIEKLYNFGIFKLASGNLPFAIEYLNDIEKAALLDDINTIADLIDDLVDFGLCELIKDRNIENVDLERAALIIEKLYELNIINNRDEELLLNLYNYVLGLAGEKLGLSVTSKDVAEINPEQEFVNIANIVRSLKSVLEAQNITDLADLLVIVKEKQFANKEFYNKETFEALIDVVVAATDLQLIELITPQLIDFVVEFASEKGLDVSFLNDGQYADLLVEDLVLILETVKENAYEAGLLDFVFDKTLNPVVTEELVKILDFIPESHLMDLYSADIFAVLASKVYGMLNVYVEVKADKFTALDVETEIETIKEVLLIVADILDTKGINELNNLKGYINGKFYLQKDVLDGISEELQALLNNVLDLQFIELTIVDIFNKHVGNVAFADFNQLVGKFEASELISDIKVVVNLLDDLIDTNIIGVVFGESLDDLVVDLDVYAGLLEEIKGLNVLNKHWNYVAATLVNMGLSKLSENVKVDADLYETVSFEEELAIIIAAFPEVNEVLKALTDKDVYTVGDILNAVKEVKFNAEILDVLAAAINLVGKLIELDTIENSLTKVVEAIADKFEIVDFLANGLNNLELSNDVKTALEIAEIALEEGLLEQALTDAKSIELDFVVIEEILVLAQDLYVVENNYGKLVELGINSSLAKLANTKVEEGLYEGISFVDEIEDLINALPELQAVVKELTGKEVATVDEVLKAFTTLKFNAEIVPFAEAAILLAEELIAAETLVQSVNVLIDVLVEKCPGIDFLFENLDKELVIEDIKTILDVAESLIEYGIMEFFYANGVIDVTSAGAAVINNAIYELFNLNVLESTKEELLDFVLGKVSVDDADFNNYLWNEEIAELQDVVSEIYVLFEENQLTSLEEIKQVVKVENLLEVLENNCEQIINVLHEVVESKLSVLGAAVGITSALKAAKNADLQALIENLSTTELSEDILTLVNIIDDAVDADLILLLFGGDVKELEFNFDAYEGIVNGLVELNIVNKNWDILGSLLVNSLNDKQGIAKVEATDLEGINFADEMQNILAILDIVEAICEHLDINCINDIAPLLKEFKEIKILNNVLAEQLVDILELANDIETVNLLYPALSAMLNTMLNNKGLDLGFMFEGQTAKTLTEDVTSLIDMLDQLVELGVVEFAVMDEEISYDDLTPITIVISTIFGLNLVQGNENQLLEFVLDKVGLDKEKAELELINDWANEADNLNDIIVAFISLLDEKELTSIEKINEMFFVKAYLDKDFYDHVTGDLIVNLIVEVVDSNLIISLLPAIIEKVLDKVGVSGLDFLEELTAEELANDILALASTIPALIDSKLLLVLFGGSFNELEFNFNAYCEILTCIENMNILNKGYANILELVLNVVLNKVGSDYRTTAVEYADILFYEDVQNIKVVLQELEKLCDGLDIVYGSDFSAVIKNIKETKEFDVKNLENIIDVLEAVINIESLQKALPSLCVILTEIIAEKGTDISFLFEDQTSDTLTQDFESVIAMIDTLVQSGLAEFLFMGQKYNLRNVEPITSVLETLFNLNILVGNGAEVLNLVATKLGLDLSDADLESIDYAYEVELFVELVEKLVYVAAVTNCDYMRDIFQINFKDFLLPIEKTNDFIQNFADIFDILSQSKVVEELALPFSAKFLNKKGNLTGLLDLENIYNNGSELSSDLVALRDILLGLKELDVFGFLHGFVKFPFDKNETVNEMITSLFNMYYLNNGQARFQTVVYALGKLVNIDLEQYDFSNVDLVSDAEKLCAMVDELSLVLTNENWLVVDVATVKPFEISKEFLTDYEVIENVFDALSHLVNTTLYSECGALAIRVLPKLANIFAKVYNALDLADLDFAEMSYELSVYKYVVNELEKLQIVEMHKTYDFFTKDFRDSIINIINGLFESQILTDHINEIVQVLVNKFLYGKTIAGITFGYDFLDIDAIDFVGDKDRLIAIIDEFYTLLLKETYGEFSGDVYEDFIDEMIRYSFVYGLDDLYDYAYSMRKNLYSYFEFEYRYEFFENVIDLLFNSSLLQTNGQPIANYFVSKLGNGRLGKLLDVSEFTNDEFAEDLITVSVLVKQLRELGLYTFIRDENINYDQAELVKEFFNNLAKLNYFDHNLYALIDCVESLNILPFSIAGLKSSDFDVENDMKLMGEIYEIITPLLTSDANPFVNKSVYKDFINNKRMFVTPLYELCYDNKYVVVEAYDKFVYITAVPLVAKEVLEYIKTKTPDKVDKIINALDVESLTSSEIREDLLVSADIFRTLVDIEIEKILKEKDLYWYNPVTSTLTGSPVSVETIDLVKLLIDQVYSLNSFNNYEGLVLKVLKTLGVDTQTIDLSGVDWDYEVELLKDIIDNGAALADQYGFNSVRELTRYAKKLVKNLNDKSALINEARKMYNELDFAILGDIFASLGESKVFVEIFNPTFMSLIQPKAPSIVQSYLDLTGYTSEELDKDLDELATICYSIADIRNAVVQSGNRFKDNVENAAVIADAETALEAALKLNILTDKKNEILAFVDRKISYDLGGVNVENIDLQAEASKIADLADHILYIFGATNYLRNWKQTSHLGNTDLMEHGIALYEGLVDTTALKELAYWLQERYAAKFNSIAPELQAYDNAQVDLLLNNIAVTLNAMLEMGVFSNNEIDFTNSALTDKLFVVFEQVFAGRTKAMSLINKVKNNMDLLGNVPVDYSDTVFAEEYSTALSLVRKAYNFYKNYKGILNKDFTILADSQCQSDIIELFNTGLNSKLFAQLVLPVANNVVKNYTSNKVQINILDGVDNTTFVEQFLPDIFKVINAAYPLGILEKKLVYTDADALIALAQAVIFNETLKSHLNDLAMFALRYVKVDTTTIDLSDVNWEEEYGYISAALTAMKAPLLNVKLSDLNTIKNNEFLTAASAALTCLENSNLVLAVGRNVLDKLVSKVYGTQYDEFVDHLFVSSYTDALLKEDFSKLDDIILNIVASDYFNGGLDYANLDPVVKAVESLLNLNYANGAEELLVSKLFSIVPLLADYAIDFALVTDWTVEKDEFIDVLEAMSDLLKLVDLNNITTSDLNNNAVQDKLVVLVQESSESEIGVQLLPAIYDDSIAPLLGSDYQDIIDFSDSTFTPDMWADEFEKVLELNEALNEIGYDSTINVTLEQANKIMAMLFGPSYAQYKLGIYTATKNDEAYEAWIDRLVAHDVIKVGDNLEYSKEAVDAKVALGTYTYKEETYRIMDLMQGLLPFVNGEGKFQLSVLYASKEKVSLNTALTEMSEVIGLRGNLYQVVQDAPSAVVTLLNVNADYYSEYLAWLADKTYYGVFWKDETLEDLAKKIADANA